MCGSGVRPLLDGGVRLGRGHVVKQRLGRRPVLAVDNHRTRIHRHLLPLGRDQPHDVDAGHRLELAQLLEPDGCLAACDHLADGLGRDHVGFVCEAFAQVHAREQGFGQVDPAGAVGVGNRGAIEQHLTQLTHCADSRLGLTFAYGYGNE